MNFNFNIISNISLYTGYYNLSDLFEESEFIKVISNFNINDHFNWNKILLTSIIPSRFLYDDIYSYDYPTKSIQKDKETVLKYFSNVIEFKVDQVKICTCVTHHYDFENKIIIIPNIKCILLSKEDKFNKFNLEYTYYKILITSY